MPLEREAFRLTMYLGDQPTLQSYHLFDISMILEGRSLLCYSTEAGGLEAA